MAGTASKPSALAMPGVRREAERRADRRRRELHPQRLGQPRFARRRESGRRRAQGRGAVAARQPRQGAGGHADLPLQRRPRGLSRRRERAMNASAVRLWLLAISFVAWLLLAATAVSAQLLPHGDRAQGEALAKNVCAACHGDDGNSVDPDYPKLAGQSARLSLRPAAGFQGAGSSTRQRGHGSDGREPDATSQMRDVSAYFARADSARHRTAERAGQSETGCARPVHLSARHRRQARRSGMRLVPRAQRRRSAAGVSAPGRANMNSTWSSSSSNSARIAATAIPAR